MCFFVVGWHDFLSFTFYASWCLALKRFSLKSRTKVNDPTDETHRRINLWTEKKRNKKQVAKREITRKKTFHRCNRECQWKIKTKNKYDINFRFSASHPIYIDIRLKYSNIKTKQNTKNWINCTRKKRKHRALKKHFNKYYSPKIVPLHKDARFVLFALCIARFRVSQSWCLSFRMCAKMNKTISKNMKHPNAFINAMKLPQSSGGGGHISICKRLRMQKPYTYTNTNTQAAYSIH